MAEIRYFGKDDQPPRRRKLTPEQKKREASDARFQEAKVREREAIATLRENELKLQRAELHENKVCLRMNAFAVTCITERMRSSPTTLLRLTMATLPGKLRHLDNDDKHKLRMAYDKWYRVMLTEWRTNLRRGPAAFLKEEAS